MIVIVDYGMGNLGSIQNMFKRVGAPVKVSSDLEEISIAKKLLLPGVGSFDQAIKRINGEGYREVLEQKVLIDQVPLLGICLGMQLLTNGSEEGSLPGLGWIDAKTIRFPTGTGLKVPHMGWNITTSCRGSALTEGLNEESRFYFVHSYYVHVKDEVNSILKANYGVSFDAAIQHGNIFGAQFHPEKSHRYGMQIFKNFASL